MKISTKGTYALRIMTDIARYEQDKPVTISALKDATNISEKYLEKIVNKLLKSKLLCSFRGANGGYKLSKQAEEITVFEILNATEGNLKSVSCIGSGENCDYYDRCITVNFWIGLDKVVNDYLKSVTLADVLNKNTKISK